MQENVTPEMVRSVYSRTAEPKATLLELSAEGIDTLYFTDWSEGLTSNGQVYEFFPFSFKWPGASTDEQTRVAKLEIFNRDRRISEAIRIATGKPELTVSLVRIATPDVVEMAITGAGIDDVEIDDPEVTGTIMPRSFKTEAACSARYVFSRTPGLF